MDKREGGNDKNKENKLSSLSYSKKKNYFEIEPTQRSNKVITLSACHYVQNCIKSRSNLRRCLFVEVSKRRKKMKRLTGSETVDWMIGPTGSDNTGEPVK